MSGISISIDGTAENGASKLLIDPIVAGGQVVYMINICPYDESETFRAHAEDSGIPNGAVYFDVAVRPSDYKLSHLRHL